MDGTPNTTAPDTPPPTTSIEIRAKEFLFQQIKSQGISFVVIILVAFNFYRENAELRAEIKSCNGAMIALYEANQEKLLQVIQANTLVLKSHNLE